MDWRKKYRWQRTWGDETGIDGTKREDYAGYDGEENIGRIFMETSGPTKDLWRWVGGPPEKLKRRSVMPNSGYCFTARDAAQKVEEYWDEMKARQGTQNLGTKKSRPVHEGPGG